MKLDLKIRIELQFWIWLPAVFGYTDLWNILTMSGNVLYAHYLSSIHHYYELNLKISFALFSLLPFEFNH